MGLSDVFTDTNWNDIPKKLEKFTYHSYICGIIRSFFFDPVEDIGKFQQKFYNKPKI